VSIGDAAARDADSMRNIRIAAASAIGENPDLGDAITVTTQGPAAAGQAGDYGVTAAYAQTRTAKAVTPPQPSPFPWTAFWISAGVAVAVGAAAAFAQVRRSGRQPRRLSDAERREFADRFQALLEGGEGDAADPL